MRQRAVFTLVLLMAVALVGQAPDTSKAVELEQESHYKELLKNDSVHVWMLELKPLEATAMHRHRADFLQIELQDADTSTTWLTDPPSVPARKQFNEGEMWYLPGRVHAVKNESTTTAVRQIEIELLKRGSSANYIRDAYDDALQPKYLPPPVDPLGNYNDTGSLYNVYLTHSQLLPGVTSRMHEHKASQLVVAMSDLELKDEREGKPTVTVKLNKGEVRWVEGGFKHKLTNVGNRPAQVVTVEYR